jgi:DNA-binding NarL/FixJ family response regulator
MKKVLIIEDEARTRQNLVTILTMEGYSAIDAAEGRTGVELAKRALPDLILCDVTMPELDGYGVLQQLRADKATAAIPFIFLTAKGDKRDQRAGMNLGADDYLTKPVTATDLLAAIAARLEREQHRPLANFAPDFSSAAPLEGLGLTPREAEVLLWIAQGKSNGEIAAILGASEGTIKIHVSHVFEKLAIDNRHAATVRALEVLSSPKRS